MATFIHQKEKKIYIFVSKTNLMKRVIWESQEAVYFEKTFDLQ